MSRYFVSALITLLVTSTAGIGQIIDHRCTDIARIPDKAIEKAQKEFRISYGHTSHGSQIISGLEALKHANPVLYNFSTSLKKSPSGCLSIWDRVPKGDLGNPNREEWAKRTERLLNGVGKSRNLVMWSWCGQVSSASKRDIQTYLKLMDRLERKFPKVKFVYMTGHLDGSGEKGQLHKRNEQIRDYCRKNNKILFDFADIESYAPTGSTNYMKFGARDDCSFRYKGKKYNWAGKWLESNPEHKISLPQKAAHTHPLNAALKGRAFWWMLAELSGWSPKSRDHNKEIRPVTKTAPPVEKNSSKSVSKVYTFQKVQDYRPWIAMETKKIIIPENGTGLIAPYEKKLSAIMYRGQMCITELAFKAELERGNTINWYINSDWNGSWKPPVGIGGVINKKRCMLIVNGKIYKYKKTVNVKSGQLYFKIVVRDNKVDWKINNKTVAQKEIPQSLATHNGSLVLGGWKSQIRFNEVYFKTR